MSFLVSKARAFARDYRNGPDRIRIKLDHWRDQIAPRGTLEKVLFKDDIDASLSGLFQAPEGTKLASVPPAAFEELLKQRRQGLRDSRRAFDSSHDGTTTLGRICYAVCRLLQPRVVVETGVAHGVTSAYVLQALADNGAGELYSVDLPPLGAASETFVGYLVPRVLRHRWTLRIGPARKLLPKILSEAGPLDLFIHDSLHTYAHMKWEFAMAISVLRPGGVLIADDIEGNRAFEEVLDEPRVASWFAMKEEGKSAICGAVRTKV